MVNEENITELINMTQWRLQRMRASLKDKNFIDVIKQSQHVREFATEIQNEVIK